MGLCSSVSLLSVDLHIALIPIFLQQDTQGVLQWLRYSCLALAKQSHAEYYLHRLSTDVCLPLMLNSIKLIIMTELQVLVSFKLLSVAGSKCVCACMSVKDGGIFCSDKKSPQSAPACRCNGYIPLCTPPGSFFLFYFQPWIESNILSSFTPGVIKINTVRALTEKAVNHENLLFKLELMVLPLCLCDSDTTVAPAGTRATMNTQTCVCLFVHLMQNCTMLYSPINYMSVHNMALLCMEIYGTVLR